MGPGDEGKGLRTSGNRRRSSRSWVIHSSDRPAASPSTASSTAAAVPESRWAVGSSRRRTGRSASRALATLRRCSGAAKLHLDLALAVQPDLL